MKVSIQRKEVVRNQPKIVDLSKIDELPNLKWPPIKLKGVTGQKRAKMSNRLRKSLNPMLRVLSPEARRQDHVTWE